jgi:hypothetical protein
MARTAVIAGTATAVSENVTSRGAAKGRQQAEVAALQEQQRAATQQGAIDQAVAQLLAAQRQTQPHTPPAQPTEEDFLGRLQKLADLRQQGMLSDAEFAAAKAKLLGG